MSAAVAARLREEFPWLTDEDIKIAEAHGRRVGDGSASGSGEAAGAREERGAPVVRRLDPDAEVEEAHADCMRRLEEFRDAWADEHDVEDSHFYLFFPGGFWTETFLGKVSDCAMAKARGHTHRFCLLFSWPKVKSFTFGAHGEAAAVQLAKEWCRKGHFFFSVWMGSDCAEEFASDSDFEYEEDLDFLNFACGVDVDSPTFEAIMLLRHKRPRLVSG